MLLTNLIRCDREFCDYLTALKALHKSEQKLPIAVSGLAAGARDIFLVESVRETLLLSSSPILILVSAEGEIEPLVGALADHGIDSVGYKSRDFVFYNIKASHDSDRERLSVLSAVISGEARVIVSTAEAAMQYTLSKSTLASMSINLKVGDEAAPESIAKRLTSLGFMHTDQVDGKGQFSRRGDILDFWGGESDNPNRIEFFGDEIDRITYFDPITQRTLKMCERVKLLPARELLPDGEARLRIEKTLEELIGACHDEGTRERLHRELGTVRSGTSLDFADRFMGLIYPDAETLADHISEKNSSSKPTVFILGTNEVREALEKRITHIGAQTEGFLKSGMINKKCARYLGDLKAYNSLINDNNCVHLNAFSSGVNGNLSGLFGFRTRRCVSYGDNPTMLIQDLQGYKKSYYRVIIACENEQGLNSLAEVLKSEGFAAMRLPDEEDFAENSRKADKSKTISKNTDKSESHTAENGKKASHIGADSRENDAKKGLNDAENRVMGGKNRVKGASFDISKADGSVIYLTVSSLRGFDLINPKIALISMAKDTGRAVMKRRRQQRMIKKLGGSGERLMSYADLTVGDYVVHANYGIGLFLGIETVTALGVTKDYITIQYAGTDRLFVPCENLEMIGKYIGEKDKNGQVKLSKMGGTEWVRTKNKAKGAARDIAKKLIELYAKRQRSEGFAYDEDSDLEMSFADAFMFEETPSQLEAIEQIKHDMMKACPMNRLLCGDVGFGKTEVAFRAAFKAIMGGKQVAFLVPTTILALQHFQTAISRFRGYPVTVEMLTRFKKPREITEILKRLRRGEIDIIIGTHKLFSKSIEFRDLGLLIIDEEQRFGVAQKERLKEFFVGVDVLTLTATPIPRTLNMAMNGISDISLLDEAPEERRPVQTYVLEHDNAIILDALRRELARGGQVLYLYNKIETIEFIADSIQTELPEARVAFAHGQMDKDELEDVWQLLVRGELDILVCTTIIETGVDLPNANTLIIEDADRFGLAQLHQIRGRVGRSERQAYAYFTYRPGKALSEVAEKRLEAIKEFAEFGAGFKIALRDLEIRGAGNLLGAEQHGYIDAVGYDLYCKLLGEAVLEEKGEFKPKPTDAQIDMKISAHIPSSYIPAESERMEMYKKISLIRTEEDKSDIEDELCDRFGEIPRVTERLLYVAASRAMASELGIAKISVTESMITIITEKPELALWSEVFAANSGMRFAPNNPQQILYRFIAAEPARVVYDIVSLAYKTKCEMEKA